MKKEIELDLIIKELFDFLAKKNLCVAEAKLILERCSKRIDFVTKLKANDIRENK